MRYIRPGFIAAFTLGLVLLAAAGGFALTRSGDSGVKAADAPPDRITADAPGAQPVAIQPEVTETLAQETAVGVIISLRTDRPPTALDLPTLKQEVAAKQGSVLSALSPSDFAVSHQYDAVPAIAGRVSAAGLAILANHPDVAAIEIDRVGYATLGQSVPLINADDVHTDPSPATGSGVEVAVLDTGAFIGHNDLSDGDILSESCFLTSVIGAPPPGPCPANMADTCFGPGCAADDNGHGSHVTGIITSCGDGAACPGSTGLVGVAPDADIHAYKVLNAGGSGQFSDFLAALNDIIANRPNVKLVNMSLGDSTAWGPGNCDGMAIAIAINMLRARGTTTVVASGNDGYKMGMNLPACVSTAVSVGMTYDALFANFNWPGVPCTDSPANQDQVTCASNSDRSLDLLAPGATIDSLSHLVAGGTVAKNGTSMATPHIAGVMALVLELNAGYTPDQLEYCLESSALVNPTDTNGVTTPRVDAFESVYNCSTSPTPVDQEALFSVLSPDINMAATACEAGALLALPGSGAGGACNRVAPKPDLQLAPSALGLDIAGQMTDELDAISLDEPFVGPLAPAFHFSVDSSAVGAAGCVAPDVNSQATAGEAQGDIFTDLAPPASPANCNARFQDELTQGLVAPGATPAGGTDDMDALTEPYTGGAFHPTCPAALGGVCPPFSVASGSTVVGSNDAFGTAISTANLLVPPGTPQTGIMGGACPAAAGSLPCVAIPESDLGLVPGDDLDALCWFDNKPNGLPDRPPCMAGPGIDGDDYFFSLAPGSPTLATLGVGPGAILGTPIGTCPPAPPTVVAPEAALGLLAADNLDGLKCINGGGAQLSTLPEPEQHYQCYYAPSGEDPLDEVDIETQFGTVYDVPVGEAFEVCAPAKKNGEGPELNDTHLKCYWIDTYPWDPDYEVDLTTQFGLEPGIEVGQAQALCVPATKTFGLDPPPPPPDAPHYVCYDIWYDTGQTWPVSVQDQFQTYDPQTIGPQVWWLCAPAIKDGHGNLDEPHLKCYDSITPYLYEYVNLQTQFGIQMDVQLLQGEMLCVEAEKTVVDTTPPDVTIDQAVGQPDPTNASPINFTVVFSEPVTGFASGDVTLSGGAGATTDTVTGGPTTYNVAVTGMTGTGTVTADIGAGVAQDAAGNPNNASSSTDNTVTYDITPPGVTIDQAGGQPDPTSVSPINFTAVFSEPVTLFASGDVTLSGTAGATTDTVTGGPTTYNVAVTGMTGTGTVTADIGAGVAQDAAGNLNTASTSGDNTVTYSTTASPTEPFFSTSNLFTPGGHDITPNLNAGGLECSSEDLLAIPGGGPGGGACSARVLPAPPGPVPDAVTVAFADLGLGIGGPFFDDLNAVSFGEFVNNGVYDYDFSVDANPLNGGVTTAVGMSCGIVPDVTTEAAIPEAQGDIFNMGTAAPVGCNTQVTDEAALGLIAPNIGPGIPPLDEMDALTEVLQGGPPGGPCTLLNNGMPSTCPAFSIMDGGAGTLAAGLIPPDAHSGMMPDEGSILVPPSSPIIPPAIPIPFANCAGYSGGFPCVAVHSTHLGLFPGPGGGDEIDALCWFDTFPNLLPDLPNPWQPGAGDYYIFSLTPASYLVTLGPDGLAGNGDEYSAADLLTVNPIAGGLPVVLVPPAQLGLLTTDNVDGLICRDFDTDLDGVPDQLDNCPVNGNTPQVNTDVVLAAGGATLAVGVPLVGDTLGDVCDPERDNDSGSQTQDPGTAAVACPPGVMPLWADCVETYLGTVLGDNCTAGPGPGGDAYPPDITIDGSVNILDVFPMFPFWLQSVPPAAIRHDLNADGTVNILDVFPMFPFWLQTCS